MGQSWQPSNSAELAEAWFDGGDEARGVAAIGEGVGVAGANQVAQPRFPCLDRKRCPIPATTVCYYVCGGGGLAVE